MFTHFGRDLNYFDWNTEKLLLVSSRTIMLHRSVLKLLPVLVLFLLFVLTVLIVKISFANSCLYPSLGGI